MRAAATDDTEPSTTSRWWSERADDAVTTLLRLDRAQLSGVNITDQTGRVLRIRPQRFQRLDSISADGTHFPSDPQAFRAETFLQARDLYGGRPSLRMDVPRLRCAIRAVVDAPARDLADFTTRMAQLLHPGDLQAPIDAPLSSRELMALLHRGSDATALDELPRPLLRHLPSYGIAAATHLLQHAASPPPSTLLLTAIHLPLRKKEPRWLLRNSRPVLLQPFLRRLLATAIFRRQQRVLEANGAIPSEMFAYRAQMAPQQAGLLLGAVRTLFSFSPEHHAST